MPPPNLELVLEVRVQVGVPIELGTVGRGRRRIVPILGGTSEGGAGYRDLLNGRVLAGGADWQLIRSDGSAYLDARYTLETDDGALIYVKNKGYRHGSKEVIERLARGEEIDPSQYYMRTAPWFETSAAKYAWLNRTVCVGTGARRSDCVELEFHEVK